MLVLSRKAGESVVLKVGNKKIMVHFMRNNGLQMRIGIDAPKEVLILRSELEERSNETISTR